MATQRDTRVEVEIDGAWTDITDYVLAEGVTITRGRADEASAADPSSCSLTLKNNDGRFSPRNPSSPYFGLFGRNTPLRVGVGTPPAAAGTTGQTGTSIVAPSVTAEATGRLFCAFTTTPSDNFTWPGGFTTGTERVGLQMTCNAGHKSVSAGATGTTTVTHPLSATAAAAASVWISGAISSTFTSSAIVTGTFTQTAISVTAGQHILFWNIWSSDPDDQMRHAPYSDDLNMDWVAVYDSGPSEGQRIRGWLAHVDHTDASFTIGATGASGVDNYRCVHVLTDADDYWPRFTGRISECPTRWDKSEALVTVPVVANGVLRRLAAGDAVPSPMRRSLQDRSDVVAYWPLEDSSGATEFASGLAGHPPMAFLGSPVPAADDSFPCSAPLPTFTAAGGSGAVPAHDTTDVYYLGALVNLPAAGTADESMLLSAWSVGGTIARWTLKYDSTGSNGIRIEAFDREGATLLSVAPGPWTPDLAGSRRLVFLRIETDGSDVDYDLWVVAGLEDGDLTAQSAAGTIAGQTKGRINTVAVGRELDLTNDISFGHIFLATASPFVGSGNTYGAVAAYVAEETWVRFRRLCRELYIDSYTANGDLGEQEEMGPQPQVPAIDLLRECEAAELGQLYEARGFPGLSFIMHRWKENLPALATLDYSAGEISEPLEPTDDDQRLANDVTVTRDDGSSVRVEDAVSVAALGRYAQSTDLNLHADAQLVDQANWRLHVGTVDVARYPVVRVELAANPDLIETVAAVEVGDKITLTNMPSWLPPDDVELIVEGYTEMIVWPNVWDITFNCSPAETLDVAVETLARADSETTTLDEDLTTTETGVNIAVESGSALWVTTALHPAEFPFDVKVGGEVMTVTACTTTGATTQTLTVTRSVNGVVKTHSTGAQLSLADPVVFTF